MMFIIFFFFFQAEDGIRDHCVTGVQTCALPISQRYSVVRERQARDFTLAWPLLRRCAIRLGEILVSRDLTDAAEDVFFLPRSELDRREDLREALAERKRTWERERRLAAP